MISIDFLNKTLFTSKKPLSFSCPTCHNGHLRVTAEDIHKRKTYDEIQVRNQLSSKINYDMFRFVAIPACDSCGETVSIMGIANFYNELDYKANSGYMGHKYVGFTPIFYNPPINIFKISTYCPENIRNSVLKAFSHFWNDLSSAANRIRTSVELIMDEQGIPETGTLHSRISNYTKINPECGNKLMAVKWIGNVGSHKTDVSKEDVIIGFELLEWVIEELYERPNRINRLNNISETINKNKGISS